MSYLSADDGRKRVRLGRVNTRVAANHSNSELRVLPGDSYHVAATDADRCAQETREFILKHRKS